MARAASAGRTRLRPRRLRRHRKKAVGNRVSEKPMVSLDRLCSKIGITRPERRDQFTEVGRRDGMTAEIEHPHDPVCMIPNPTEPVSGEGACCGSEQIAQLAL
ncbi:hypothetical protein [Bosea sp. NBC_00550]|uniref:hypothetical protein n=1 Tax=Bosea sp. NBC_00550 TaxID=2969621 RepID=UPI00222FCC55|nr:hypothetical protein [Bosea sp. NBC_00550]UZF90933.1 hypothetical protein NWE53_17540 [Bosea sp. NBC_00550]